MTKKRNNRKMYSKKVRIKKTLMSNPVTRKMFRAYLQARLERQNDSLEEYRGYTVYRYAKEYGCKLRIVEKSRVRKVLVKPEEITQSGKKEFGYIKCIPHYVCELRDAILTSETESMIVDHFYLNDRIVTYPECSVDFLASPPHFLTADYKQQHIYTRTITVDKEIECGIDLVGRWPSHIWHLSIEILGRLRLVNEFPEYDKLPLIIDEKVFSDSRNKELLDFVNRENREIIILPANQTWRVKRLIYPSQTAPERMGYYDNPCVTGKKKKKDKIFLYWDEKSVDFLRDRVMKKGIVAHKRIFIRRRDNRLVNEQEVFEFFRKYGFEEYDPENLTFAQEVDAFQNAEYMIGAVGGAFTNSMFASEGSTVCMIMPSIFSDAISNLDIALHLNSKWYVINAELEKGWQVPGSQFRLPLSTCRKVVKELGIESEK